MPHAGISSGDLYGTAVMKRKFAGVHLPVNLPVCIGLRPNSAEHQAACFQKPWDEK